MLGKRKLTGSTPPLRKRNKTTPAVDEITFDFNAREDYLTGFHKRKLQRIKHAQEEAAKRAREERVIARKTLREGRKADLVKHVEEVNALLKKAGGDGTPSDIEDDEVTSQEWDGIPEPVPIDEEAEYIDEDRHTTVTIEAVDVTKDGLQKVVEEDIESGEEDHGSGSEATPKMAGQSEVKTKRVWTKERPGGPKKKKKKFRYESKAERKVTRYKERSGNRAKAKARKE